MEKCKPSSLHEHSTEYTIVQKEMAANEKHVVKPGTKGMFQSKYCIIRISGQLPMIYHYCDYPSHIKCTSACKACLSVGEASE